MEKKEQAIRLNWRKLPLKELNRAEMDELRRERKEERETVLPKQGSIEHMRLEVYEYNRLLKHPNVRLNWQDINASARNEEESEIARIARIKEIRSRREGFDNYYFSPDD